MLWVQQKNGQARSLPSMINDMILTLIVETLFEQVDEDSYRILEVSLKTLYRVFRFSYYDMHVREIPARAKSSYDPRQRDDADEPEQFDDDTSGDSVNSIPIRQLKPCIYGEATFVGHPDDFLRLGHDVCLLRPSLEHEISGMIIGRGGDQALGATFWR